MKVKARVRHQAMRLGGLIEVITEVSIADFSVRVLTSDSVNLVAVTALLAVEFEAAGEAFHLKHVAFHLKHVDVYVVV